MRERERGRKKEFMKNGTGLRDRKGLERKDCRQSIRQEGRNVDAKTEEEQREDDVFLRVRNIE